MSNASVNLSLRDSLQQIANLADEENISAKEKAKRLGELSEPVLQLLETTIKEVGGTRRRLLEDLKGIIESGDWASLPTPVDIKLTMDKIDRISFSIQDAKNNLSVDAESILRILLEIMRKSMLENKFAQTQQHKADMDAAEAAKTARKNANLKQRNSELATAVAQGVAAVASISGAALSVNAAINSGLAARQATKLAKGDKAQGTKSIIRQEIDLQENQDILKNYKEIKVDFERKLRDFKNLNLKGPNRRNQEEENYFKVLADKKQTMEVRLENIKQKSDYLSQDIRKKNESYKKISNEISKLTKNSEIETARANAYQAIGGAVGGLVNSIGGITSAMFKYDSGTEQGIAEQKAVEREVAQKMYQAAGESASSAKEGLRSAIQMISAIQQTLGNLNSLLARHSV